MSCTYGTDGIFYSLENEEKVYTANGINSNVTVLSMAERGNYLYIACGPKFYSRIKNTITWVGFNLGGQEFAYAVAQGNAATLWAITGPASTGNTNYLYYTNDDSNWISYDYAAHGISGTPVNLIPITGPDGYSMVGQSASGGCILVTVNPVTNDYSSAYILKGNGDTPIKIDLLTPAKTVTASLTGVGNPITSAAYDGNYYYLANKSFIWFANPTTGAALLLTYASFGTTLGNGFNTICFVDNSKLRSSGLPVYPTNIGTDNRTGYVYSVGLSSDSTNNNSLIFLFKPADPSTPTNLNAPTPAISLSSSLYSSAINATSMVMDNYALLIGGRGVGYGELSGNLTFSKPTSASTSTSNYFSTILSSATVSVMYYSVNENKLFLGASGNGLWSRDPNDSYKWKLQ